jgi:O-antigen/teichoic acid export membrane protein
MLNKSLVRFNKPNTSDGLGSQLAKRATGTFVLKIAMIALSFGTNILLTRTLGAKDFGLFTYTSTWLTLLQIPADFGLTGTTVRMVAVYSVQSKWALMRGFLGWGNLMVSSIAIGLGLAAALGAWVFRAQLAPDILPMIWLGLLALPFYALTSLRQSTMRGLHQVILGQLPEFIIQPLLFVAAFVASKALLGERLNVSWVMGLRFLSVMLAYNIGAEMLRRSLPKEINSAFPSHEIGHWLKSTFPFLLSACMMAINTKTSTLMLGAMRGATEVGLYVVASRGADLLVFLLGVVNLSIASNFAQIYAQGNIEKLQKVVTQSTRTTFFMTLPMAIGFIIFGHWFLLVFGAEFTQSYPVLVILSIGQIFNAFAGSVGPLLSMTGHEKEMVVGRAISIIINLGLNILLIPTNGSSGAAIATAISVVTSNLVLIIFTYKKVGIHTTVFGKIKFSKSSF